MVGQMQYAPDTMIQLGLIYCIGLHELDPAFRKVTLESTRVKDLVKSLGFHKDPVG